MRGHGRVRTRSNRICWRKSPKQPMFETMTDKKVMTDGQQTLELYYVKGSGHHTGMIFVYSPRARAVYWGDGYNPPEGDDPRDPARTPEFGLDLYRNIMASGVNVERIAPAHGAGARPFDNLTESHRPDGRHAITAAGGRILTCESGNALACFFAPQPTKPEITPATFSGCSAYTRWPLLLMMCSSVRSTTLLTRLHQIDAERVGRRRIVVTPDDQRRRLQHALVDAIERLEFRLVHPPRGRAHVRVPKRICFTNSGFARTHSSRAALNLRVRPP